MNKEELYKKALTNVHRYSLLNEIFAIRDNRYPNETTDYTIMVNGYISLDVLNRYVRNIDELIKYQNIDTIKNLEQLQQENKQLKERVKYLERSNNHREDKIALQRQELIYLDERIEKAIKVIEEVLESWEKEKQYHLGLNITELLEILKGEE